MASIRSTALLLLIVVMLLEGNLLHALCHNLSKRAVLSIRSRVRKLEAHTAFPSSGREITYCVKVACRVLILFISVCNLMI